MVVFETAKALVAQDTNNTTDVYAFLSDGTFHLVSSKADGTGVQLASGNASVSGDGRFVVFTSSSEQLVPGDSNGYGDVFVKDLYTGEIALVSTSADLGDQAFVSMLYTHVIGVAPSDGRRDALASLLQGSGGGFSQGQLLAVAADTELNAGNVGLVGLQQNGVALM